MKVTALELPGLLLIELQVFTDSRGFFTEHFNAKKFAANGLPSSFVQANHSRSSPGVLRGLHYQVNPAQGKLVGAIRGAIFDVTVDIRPGSPTFGKHIGIELSDKNGRLLWVPAGFAHGFCAMGTEPSDVIYHVNAPYSPETEGGVHWADPELAIQWPTTTPIINKRDDQLPRFAEYKKTPIETFRYL